MATCCRLRDERLFRSVRAEGRAWKQPLLTLFIRPNALPVTRVGITASKRVGKAVRRNRARRLVREALRRLCPRLAGGMDLVVVARPGLAEARYADVFATVDRLAARAGLYQVY